MDKYQQESTIGSRKVLPSGTRHNIYYPPDIHCQNNGEVTGQQEARSTFITPVASEAASLVSSDYLSLPNEKRNSDCIAVSGSKKDNDLGLLNTPNQVDTDKRVYPTAPPDVNENQQARILVNDRPHSPDQDSSPHESLEQGNSSSIGTSESSYLTQHIYERVRYAKFPGKAHYHDRLLTFREWPHVTPSGADLAEAGMFFQGEIADENNRLIRDQVVCYKCGGTLFEWKKGDDPLDEHRKYFPKCCLTKWMEDL